MKYSQWLKITGIVLASSLLKLGEYAHIAGVAGEKDLENTIQSYKTSDVYKHLENQKIDSAADHRLTEHMNIHTALLFYCDPKISSKIAGLQTADKHELIKQDQNNFIVWQTDQQRPDTLQNILSMIDPDTRTQICATYDAKNHDFVMHFGGTDFFNGTDMIYAFACGLGGVSPRSAMGARFTETAIQKLHERNPQLDPKDVHTSIIAHSQGGASVPAAMMASTANGFDVNRTIILDPFGAATAFETTEKTLIIPAQDSRKHVKSIKPSKKGFLDHFKRASETVGVTEKCHAAGHLGRSFIIAYDHDRVQRMKRLLRKQLIQ